MTIQQTLSDRCSVHGSYPLHAEITRSLKDVCWVELKKAKKTLNDEQAESLDMILHKIGRIIAGNANHKDHWHDIAGYALLAEASCKEDHDL